MVGRLAKSLLSCKNFQFGLTGPQVIGSSKAERFSLDYTRWPTPLTPEFGRHRKGNLSGFKDNEMHIASSRPARTM